MQPSSKNRHEIAPLDASLAPSEIHTAAPPSTPPEEVVIPPDTRPHYVATYIDAEQLEKDNAAIAESTARQKKDRALQITICAGIYLLIGAAILGLSLLRLAPLTALVGTAALVLGYGIATRRSWSIAVVKILFLATVLLFLGSAMIGTWTGVSITQHANIIGVLLLFGATFAFLVDPRINEMFN